MESRIVARMLVLALGLWMMHLVATQGEAAAMGGPVHIDMNDRSPPTPKAVQQLSSTSMSTYIVHMDKSSFSTNAATETRSGMLSRYTQLLAKTVTKAAQGDHSSSTLDSSSTPVTRPIYHVYSSVCRGFAASLTAKEAKVLRGEIGVLGVFPETVSFPDTTRTPEFLGLRSVNGNLLSEGHFGEDVIVGMLDTGVWPERESFSDTGLSPVPAKWKGICSTGKDFAASSCNKKLIGARYFVAGYEAWLLNVTGKGLNESVESRSPRDTEGHGTHTASTAAGSPVAGASMFGLANGTARGMAPKARIAVYKVCWAGGCFGSDMLAAFDQAVADGVDVISVSVGGEAAQYFVDAIAIGGFGAMRKGVFVSASGGNAGPELQTVGNVAPWLTTVAASTLDRDFPANVILGDGQLLRGQSLYVGKPVATSPLVTGADATTGRNVTASTLCLPGSLHPSRVKGKIVLCQAGPGLVEKGKVVLAAGGVGMIVYNTGGDKGVLAEAHFLPATYVYSTDGAALLAYMSRTESPVGRLEFLGTRYDVHPAPVVAAFSSRGPNSINPYVPKPDITAPGVAILAAWTGAMGPAPVESDPRRVDFNIISGTSMSCPHVSGLAALLRSAHPTWSPAAIRSAMMTTATIYDTTQVDIIKDEIGSQSATPLHFGSGHVRPSLALDPGLIYDMNLDDYIRFLCASNYSATDIQMLTSDPIDVRCSLSSLADLNYPSFSAVFEQAPSMATITMNMTRTVTNVGCANSTYKAQIVLPSGSGSTTQITVHPELLTFTSVNEKQSFTVQVTTVNAPSTTLFNVAMIEFGSLVWTDGTRAVQSPISITMYK